MKVILKLLSLFTIFLFLSCGKKSSTNSTNIDVEEVAKPYKGTLKVIKKRGVLRVIAPDITKSAFPRNGKLLSYERDMAIELASKLGVKARIISVESYGDMIDAVENGFGDIAVGSFTITDERKKKVSFTTPIDHIYEVIIAQKNDSVNSLAEINGEVSVRGESSYFETLSKLSEEDSTLSYTIEKVDEKLHTFEVVEGVGSGKYNYTLCDSDIAETVLGYDSKIKIAFRVGETKPRGWITSKGSDKLLAYLNTFIGNQSISNTDIIRDSGDLDQIKKRNLLRVAVRNNSGTYWIYKGKEVGFEYELSRAFAKKIGVRLEMVVVPDRESLLSWVVEGRADIAASGITITAERDGEVDFGATYLTPEEVVVCAKDSQGNPLIKQVEDLFEYPIFIRKNSSYLGTLRAIEETFSKKLDIKFVSDSMETETIISQIVSGDKKVTVADDYIAKIEKSYSDKIAIGPSLSDKREVGWAVRESSLSLKESIDDFFTTNPYKMRSLKYNILYNRYFKHSSKISKSKSEFRADISGVISPYDSLMKQVAENSSGNWYLIAAQVYQESKFNPMAKSWVGAAGLMQLMPATAKEVGVTNVYDPKQSLEGGVKYLEKLIARFDKTLPLSERYNFAFASYNAGYGHLIDARKLATQMGWDRDVWFGNVEKAMLLLSKREYAKAARYGYCRGSEPVTYIQNIQRLYNHYSSIEL
jgi:membrane-bound lytic murein transglycosylase F